MSSVRLTVKPLLYKKNTDERKYILPVTRYLSSPSGEELPRPTMVFLGGGWYVACRSDFIVCNDGASFIQLWQNGDNYLRLEGTPLQCASWIQICYDAGLDIRVKIYETTSMDDHIHDPVLSEKPFLQQSGTVKIWCHELQAALKKHGVTGLDEEFFQRFTIFFRKNKLTAPELFVLMVTESDDIYYCCNESGIKYSEPDFDKVIQLLALSGFNSEQINSLSRHIFRKL